MNAYDIVQQIVRMRGLVPEVNRVVIAERFKTLITNTLKAQCGDDGERTVNWVNKESALFMAECKLTAPRAPVNVNTRVDVPDLLKFIDKWESADMWRTSSDAEYEQMSQDSFNIKAALLRELREIINVKTTTPGSESTPQQG